MTNKQVTHIPVVREWLISLGMLTAISISREEARMKLTAFIPMLMSDFPDAAFTPASLNHVAKACVKGFPIYPELHAHLSTWWREHRPAPRQIVAPAPPPPPRDPPTEAERAAVAAQLSALIAELTGRAAGADEDPAPRPREPRRAARPLTPRMLAAAYDQAGAVNPRPRLDDEAPTGEHSDP